MIFRLSQKLNTKLKAGSLNTLPLDDDRVADWSANLFVADRTQYIILSNTTSLYSTVLHGKGIANDRQFVERALGSLREFLEADGQAFVYHRFIVPASGKVSFAKALNRSITGSMNDLVVHAKMWLTEGEWSPFDVSLKLNDIPFSSLKFVNPREAFLGLVNPCDEA